MGDDVGGLGGSWDLGERRVQFHDGKMRWSMLFGAHKRYMIGWKQKKAHAKMNKWSFPPVFLSWRVAVACEGLHSCWVLLLHCRSGFPQTAFDGRHICVFGHMGFSGRCVMHRPLRVGPHQVDVMVVGHSSTTTAKPLVLIRSFW